MKVAFIGGHLAPALAVIEGLSGSKDAIFLGRKYGLEGDKAVTLEYQTITNLGIPFFEIRAGRMQRHLSRHTIPSLFKFPLGVYDAIVILKKTKPDVVIAFGGYLSLPAAYACHILDIPLVIHEQTLEAGFANKVIAPFARTICISWESSRKDFDNKNVILTGNPIRKEIQNPQIPDFSETLHSNLPLVYITGGSAGSHAINRLVMGCIGELLENTLVVHQTGDAKEFSDFEKLSALRSAMDERRARRYILKKFIDPSEVGYLYKRADVVVGRSGINTVTELLWLEKLAVLIPLPFSQRHEQQKNAYFLKEVGLSEVVPQQRATSSMLYEKITSMLGHRKSATIKKDAKKYGEIIAQAANRINQILKKAAEEKDSSTNEA